MKVLYSNFVNYLVGNGWILVRRSDGHAASPVLDDSVNTGIPSSYLEFMLNFISLTNEDESRWFLSIDEFAGGSVGAFSWNEFEKMSLGSAISDADVEDIRKFWDEHLPILMAVGGDYQFVGLGRNSGAVVYGIEPEFESVTKIADTFDDFISAAIKGQCDDLLFGR